MAFICWDLPVATLAPARAMLFVPATDFLANEKGVPRDKVKSWTPYPGGAPCNVATCLTKLGVPTAFVSAIGSDDRGEEIMQLMKGMWCSYSCNAVPLTVVAAILIWGA